MKLWAKRAAFLLAVVFLILTVVNASWLAPAPTGVVKLIAHRGLAQEFDRTGVGRDTCTAELIERPVHDYLENTARGARKAGLLGAHMIEIDIAPTADGKIAVFHDWTLDCRTDGSGPVRSATMAELKALDIGHGYTADGGQTYPLRGSGVGQLPELAELLGELPRTTRVMYNFKSDDAAEADLLASALAQAGRDPVKSRDAFYGHPAPVARIGELHPQAWSWSPEAAKSCTQDYVLTGWSGAVPSSCRDGTLIVPINRQWMFWGWPNRLIARMESVGARVIVTGPHVSGEPNTGLTLPEQVEDVPADFNGYLWVEDAWTIAPALYPGSDNRTQAERDAARAGLARRRMRD